MHVTSLPGRVRHDHSAPIAQSAVATSAAAVATSAAAVAAVAAPTAPTARAAIFPVRRGPEPAPPGGRNPDAGRPIRCGHYSAAASGVHVPLRHDGPDVGFGTTLQRDGTGGV
jgi:hypothetical protein